MTPPKSILFYRESNGIGDLAMMMRSVELTRLKYPKSRILVQSKYLDLIKGHPAIDDVVVLNHKREGKTPGAVLSGNRNLSTEGFPLHDILINQSEPCAKYESKHQPNIAKNRIEIFCDNAALILKQNGYEPIVWDGKCQQLWVDSKLKEWASLIIQNASDGKIPIGVFWRTAEKWRDWLGMNVFIKMLVNDGRFSVFCFDGNLKAPIEKINHIINYPLNQVLSLVSRMRLIVAADTAGIHLAGGVGVPILGVFGPTDPIVRLGNYQKATWMPINCKKHPCWYSTCKKKNCLRKISARNVYEKVCEIMEEIV